MSVANNGGKMSGNQKKHRTYFSLITPSHLTELSTTHFSKYLESMSTRQIIKLNINTNSYLQQKATVRYGSETCEEITIQIGLLRCNLRTIWNGTKTNYNSS